jgi:hypothetical protein
MRIDQRNAGASVTINSNQYTLDRYQAIQTQAGKYSVQQSTTAPTGFTNSMLITSASAYSVLSTDEFYFRQSIEGYNVSDLAFGTASAKTVTLSFWVRSSLTGTFGGALKNDDGDRAYPFTYTISSADTWEQKSVTIAGDTTGTWNTGNGRGLQVIFGLGVGANFSGTAGAWAGANYSSTTGAVSVVGTNGATWYVTGVQLEVGSVATPFERRPFGTELALCKRYYEIFGVGAGKATSTTVAALSFVWTVEKRTSPTIALVSGITTSQLASPGVSTRDVSAISNPILTVNGLYIEATTSGLTAGEVITSFRSEWLSASAEL